MSEGQQDPWADMPRWSDGMEPAENAPVAADAGGSSAGIVSSEPDACPWCATVAPDGATRCATCGAALAQRESIGDLVIPGLTAVDPALQDLDGRPLHLRGPSPSQGVASGLIVAAAAGGPVGLAILGGVGAIAATEYLATGGGTGKGHEHVGETSAAVLQAIERLDRGETLPNASDSTPRPEAEAAGSPDPHEHEEDDDGRA